MPIRSGIAWEAPAGSIIEISTPEGPQVGKLYLVVAVLLYNVTLRRSHEPSTRFNTINKGIIYKANMV